jgi:TorA maturation chaperone TorD
VYSFFAQALSPPTDALVSSVCDGSLRLTMDEALRGSPSKHRVVVDARLTSALVAGSPSAAREALLAEYTRLCGGALVCPHYEGDLVGGDSFRAVHVISDVAAFYAAFGVQVSGTAYERPDYIGVELDFMRFLAVKEARAIAQAQRGRARLCRKAQAKFYDEHLGRWALRFADNLIEAAEGRFYRAVGTLLRQFITAEVGYLDLHPQPAEAPSAQSPEAPPAAHVIQLTVVR